MNKTISNKEMLEQIKNDMELMNKLEKWFDQWISCDCDTDFKFDKEILKGYGESLIYEDGDNAMLVIFLKCEDHHRISISLSIDNGYEIKLINPRRQKKVNKTGKGTPRKRS